MKAEEFEDLVVKAGLTFTRASQGYGVAYSVVLQVETRYGVRFQSDWLLWEPADFAQLTPERAQQQIERSRSLMAHAATTQQGRLADERVTQVELTVQKVVRQETGVKYPAH
jgi:hypothetical protein